MILLTLKPVKELLFNFLSKCNEIDQGRILSVQPQNPLQITSRIWPKRSGKTGPNAIGLHLPHFRFLRGSIRKFRQPSIGKSRARQE